jgi:sterol 24-C-methyltransferase
MSSVAMYKLKTALKSFVAIYRLPQDQIDAFMRSYDLFEKNVVDDNEEHNIVDYYSVLNLLCSIGDVEKMYIPAVMDVTKGIFENQILFENKMSRDLDLKPGDKVLDIGCGRGRVAAHIASSTHANLTGFNIDDVQLDSAKQFAQMNGLSDSCRFLKSNLNSPFPFANESFHALYQIQALTYTKDKNALFAEMFRVLKPGGKLSFLDWVQLDNFDPNIEHHRRLLKRVKPLIGAVDTPTPHEIKSKLEAAGFEVLLSEDISVGGHQSALISKADNFYNRIRKIIDMFVSVRLLPSHFSLLFDRLTLYGDSFIEADRLRLFTTSFQTIAQKPMV